MLLTGFNWTCLDEILQLYVWPHISGVSGRMLAFDESIETRAPVIVWWPIFGNSNKTSSLLVSLNTELYLGPMDICIYCYSIFLTSFNCLCYGHAKSSFNISHSWRTWFPFCCLQTFLNCCLSDSQWVFKIFHKNVHGDIPLINQMQAFFANLSDVSFPCQNHDFWAAQNNFYTFKLIESNRN